MSNRNVVFVLDEDDPAMLRSLARMLRQFGYSSLVFPSAAAFAKQSDFDGAMRVVRDINLGDGSGIKLRHRLKAAVPVIDMTGHDTPAVRTSAFQSGCLAYLIKPFTAKSPIEPLNKALASRS